LGAYCRFWISGFVHTNPELKRFQDFRVGISNPELKKDRSRISCSSRLPAAGRLYAAVLFHKTYARTSFTGLPL